MLKIENFKMHATLIFQHMIKTLLTQIQKESHWKLDQKEISIQEELLFLDQSQPKRQKLKVIYLTNDYRLLKGNQ